MKLEDAQVGMRVKYIGKELSNGPRLNQVGIIKFSNNLKLAIEFDNQFPDGHSCSGCCKSKCGYWFYNNRRANSEKECYDYIVLAYNWRKL